MNTNASMRIQQLSRVLEQVGQRDGIQGLRLGHDGTAALKLSGGKMLCFEFNEELDLLLLYMPVLKLPLDPASRLQAVETMLKMNYLKGGCGKGELGLDPQGSEAVFQYALPAATVEVNMLDLEIDQFLRLREECRDGLEHRRHGAVTLKPAQQANSRIHLLQRLARQ